VRRWLRRDDPATIVWDLPKDRYQFIAACVELAQAIDEGPTFKTRLPLMYRTLRTIFEAAERRITDATDADERPGDDKPNHSAKAQ
jgi:hypothetical protein